MAASTAVEQKIPVSIEDRGENTKVSLSPSVDPLLNVYHPEHTLAENVAGTQATLSGSGALIPSVEQPISTGVNVKQLGGTQLAPEEKESLRVSLIKGSNNSSDWLRMQKISPRGR